jgi:hypothetical protein
VPAQVAQPDDVRAFAVELLHGQVRAVWCPHRAAVGEVTAQRDALALDTLGRERVVVGDARDSSCEAAFFTVKEHVRSMYIAIHLAHIRLALGYKKDQ